MEASKLSLDDENFELVLVVEYRAPVGDDE
jgi:hypothetical protein